MLALSQIAILYEISNRIMGDLGLHETPRLCNYFDMIGGVGTGGYVCSSRSPEISFDFVVSYLALLAGRLGLTVPQIKEEFIQLITCILMGGVSSDEFDNHLKDMVKRWTGDSETLMFDPNSLTAHCKTYVRNAQTCSLSHQLSIF